MILNIIEETCSCPNVFTKRERKGCGALGNNWSKGKTGMERDDAFFQREDATFQGVVFRVQGGVEKMTHIKRFHTSKNFFIRLYISFF